jgi:hypothetical protein
MDTKTLETIQAEVNQLYEAIAISNPKIIDIEAYFEARLRLLKLVIQIR